MLRPSPNHNDDGVDIYSLEIVILLSIISSDRTLHKYKYCRNVVIFRTSLSLD